MSDELAHSDNRKPANDRQNRVEIEKPWLSIVMLLITAAGLWLISTLLPPGDVQPFVRADSFDNWFIFGQRILCDTLRAVSILSVAIAVSSLIPAVGLWFERITFKSKRWKFLAVTAGLSVISSALFSYFVLQYFPHIQDEMANVFQAQVFASGRLYADTPELIDFFDWEFIVVDGPKWYSKYFFGPSLLMVPGIWFGTPWIINPILAGLAVLLTYAIGRNLLNEKIARVAAILMTISPFRISLFSMMMAHPACLLALALFTLSIIKAVKNPERIRWFLAAGISAGFAFNCRPLTTLVMGGVISLIALFTIKWKRVRWQSMAAFIVPALVFALLFLGYNKTLTGDAFLTPFNKWSPKDRLGFGPDVGLEYWMPQDRGLNLRKALLKHGYQNLDSLGSNLTGWGHVTLVLLIWPLVSSPWPKRTWGLAATAVGLSIAYLFYASASVLAGQARYISETMPMMILLVAIALALLRMKLPKACRKIGLVPAVRTGRSACWLAGLLFVLWSIPRAYQPLIDVCKHDFWGQGPNLRTIVDDADIQNALIFIETGHYRYTAKDNKFDYYGSGFALNDPQLNGSVIFARDLKERNAELMAAYPEKKAYRFNSKDIGTDEPLVPIEMTKTKPRP